MLAHGSTRVHISTRLFRCTFSDIFCTHPKLPKCSEDLGHSRARHFNHHQVAGADRVLCVLAVQQFVIPIQLLPHCDQLTSRDVIWQVRYKRRRPFRCDLTSFLQFDRFQNLAWSDLNYKSAATCRIETVALQFQFHFRSHPLDQRNETTLKEIERWSCWVMRSTFDFDPARPNGGNQRRQNCLKNKRSAACRADRKAKLSRANLAGHKCQSLGAQRGALYFSRTNFRRGLDCRQVLPQQSRLLSI